MATNISAELLFSLLQHEKATGELQQLQPDFYAQVNRFLDSLMSNRDSEEQSRQFENTKRMLASLAEKRKQKILLYIAYSKPLPAIVPVEDEKLYNDIRELLASGGSNQKISRLKIKSDIPEVLTTEGRRIGPFRQGEIVEVSDSSDIEFMIKNKIGEIVA
jgi:DNA replication initiation complex subunit (GINS family)